jgi:hypothetical protein
MQAERTGGFQHRVMVSVLRAPFEVPGRFLEAADRMRIERFFGEIIPRYYGETIEIMRLTS